ncbi:MAG: PhnD/SsuA/transferrin family substrate-binding protein [Gammaproteobacteria bacterium]|nr:PhnD/SsuA/transferrin family substrate-binding protein [Gammaproteobacteria bacterium]
MQPIIVGAVLYDPKVSVIWDIIRDFFEANEVPMDTVFYTNYELQVSALLAGGIEVAWNSPLAWLDAQRRSENGCRAIAMRDTDRDRCSHLIVASDGPIATLADLRGKTVAFGAQDSPQATLIPKEHLLRHGLGETDYVTRRFDLAVGKNGDHIGGELEAFRCLQRQEAAASCLIDLNWNSWTADGTIDPARYRILTTTGRYDHCVFTVRHEFPREREAPFLHALMAMDYANPKHREMMDLEGLKRWEPGRVNGFELLTAACANQQFFAGR